MQFPLPDIDGLELGQLNKYKLQPVCLFLRMPDVHDPAGIAVYWSVRTVARDVGTGNNSFPPARFGGYS